MIRLTRNEEEWEVSTNSHYGQADIEAGPNLYQVLQLGIVIYPYDLRGYMDRLWKLLLMEQAEMKFRNNLMLL